MINFLTRIFTDYRAATGTTIVSATASVSQTPLLEFSHMPLFQQIAIFIAVVSGVVAIVNGCDTFYQRHRDCFKIRVVKNWETTLFGLFLTAVGTLALILGRATVAELSPLVPVILWLFYKKTPFKKPQND